MAVANGGGASHSDLELRVMAAVKASEDRGDPPLLWAMAVGRAVNVDGLGFPSLELGQVLVSNLCFSNNRPAIWKLLDQAMACQLVYPIHVLALLTPRVIQHRIAYPEAFRLYLELLSRYALSSPSSESRAYRDKISKSIDEALQLSCAYGVNQMDFGFAVVLFFLTVITSLIDCTMEDCGVPLTSVVEHTKLYNHDVSQGMDIDIRGSTMRQEHLDHLRRTNLSMAIEIIAIMTSNEKIKVFLRLAYLNLPQKFNGLLQRLQIIEGHISASLNLTSMKSALDILFHNIQKAISDGYLLHKHQLLGTLVDSGFCSLKSCNVAGAGRDACWISFDTFFENAMNEKNVYAISSANIIAELIKILQVINQATWQETFQSLWISALRLVQRDKDPVEGPIPQLDSRLCLLLSIVPLAISSVIQEEEHELSSPSKLHIAKNARGAVPNQFTSRRHGLVSCLQLLGQYSSLLSPPPSVLNAANHAATKAAVFVSNLRSGNGNSNIVYRNESSTKAGGNMLHLIVEACIARSLLDTSAYLWPGYVTPSAPSKDSNLVQDSPWSTFLSGAPLTAPLKNSLMNTPASSLVEVEKLYLIAVNGSDEEKEAAAKILCGASLLCGWNVQEHVVRTVVKLLSPLPADSPVSGMGSNFICHIPVLGAVLLGIASVDAIHILSLFGMVPEVAAVLMPICEAFGSLPPSSSHSSSASVEPSVYNIFSYAFLFLFKFWKFYRPPQEHCIAGRGGSVRMELTLDYLLLMHNSLIASQSPYPIDRNKYTADPFHASAKQPVYIDSFPKLRTWYFQNKACIDSTLSGLSSKIPVHQVANKILNLICRKMTKAGTVAASSSSNSSGSNSGSPLILSEDSFQWQMLPAWEVLEAIPFALEAVLTACAHGRLSSRDLTTGLRDLVDLFPASLATIISYFSAEVTRGIWKPVPMDGTSWPSPAAALASVESEVKEILASAGVHIKSYYPCGMPPMLPLPMAVLVSLTITFKLDKNLTYIQELVGHALENCAIGGSWPNMPIIAALWTQKVRRWHNFIIWSCLSDPFTRDKDAIAQLISSCFSSFLGPIGSRHSHHTEQRGVYGLLGQTILDQAIHRLVKPGFLYLRSCRNFHDTHFVSKAIFKMVTKWSHKLANGSSYGPSPLKSSQISLTAAASGVEHAAMLGAVLLLSSGGAQLVQVLYEDTLPTMLLSDKEENQNSGGIISNILEGYAMAYFLFICGAFVWGLGNTSRSFITVGSKMRARIIGSHMDFMAGVLEGNTLLACDPGIWKAYVLCYVGLLVRFVPAWIPEVKQETLQKLASGLRSWHENDLAISLLERGGPAAMASIVETML